MELNDDHSCVEAMDLSQRGAFSEDVDHVFGGRSSGAFTSEGSGTRASVALPRDNEGWEPLSRRLQRATRFVFGRSASKKRLDDDEGVTLVKDDQFAIQDWRRRNNAMAAAAAGPAFRRTGTNTSINSRSSNASSR